MQEMWRYIFRRVSNKSPEGTSQKPDGFSSSGKQNAFPPYL
jgi:hypothetical protein